MIVAMFRTRDFILILTTVVFLIVGIGTTILSRSQKAVPVETVELIPSKSTDYTAIAYNNPEKKTREERLDSMRSKIAASGGITLSAPESDSEEDFVSDDLENELTENVEIEVIDEELKCSSYGKYTGDWSPQGVQFTVTEGARLVYRINQLAGVQASSSRNILLPLPIYSVPTEIQTVCLNSDVVGIAKDGSLIRNNEASIYGIFEEDVLIGYALDGFPIYGQSNFTGDECGGEMIGGYYGYYLSSERDRVLNCFSGQPIPF